MPRPRHRNHSSRLTLFTTTLLLVMGSPALPAAAAETWQVGGKTYERVRVLEANAATVMIAHAGGMVQLDLGALPSELQQRFGYDAAQAEAWKSEAASGLAATEALKRDEVHARTRRLALEEKQRRAEKRPLALGPDTVEVKAEVDLRPVFAKHGLYLRNQGARPSCTVFAIVGALEYEYARSFGRSERLSEEYLVWVLRTSRPETPINDGYHFPDVIQALREHGVPRRSLLPDSFVGLRGDSPPVEVIEDAASRRSALPVLLDVDDPSIVLQCVHALNTQTPVIIGIKWPPHSTLERNNLLKEQTPQPGAGHAVTLVGYRSDGTSGNLQFIYRNSYGPKWGLGGYGLMDGTYLQKNVVAAFCLIVHERD